ncbi:DUF6476 family protein [Pseudohoeflea coraliihabitans]|uniref:Fimbrial protein n=1 Tax=Pseudohoeflea coraliihabitans TaxID=2860393 RepID=A0ABS6WJZ9_9HYPH|nr:DUF6476 family protein [Pseudohoeflea sp. DP4N28-3]MBW3096272.1 hypothetical protein [Pseudohoeflea sp. DP4N28-3]
MTQPLPDDIDEKPLDPQMEKVRRKMVRLLAVSIGIMFVGVMAVLAAIVYKFTRGSDEAPAAASVSAPVPMDAPIAARIELPTGFSARSASLAGDRLVIFGAGSDGVSRILVFNASTGTRLATIEVGQTP